MPNNTLDALADTPYIDDGGIDIGGDSGPKLCVHANECPQVGGCLAPACDQGVCGVAPLAAGMSCTTANLCPAPGRCDAAGSCQPDGAPCDDGNPCTADQCLAAGCNHVTFPDKTACDGDGLACTNERCETGVCVATLATTWCLVDDFCAKSGQISVTDPCGICDPTLTTTAWSKRIDGDCEDDDPCTELTDCNAKGECIGTRTSCDDNNVCTNDACFRASGCVHLANALTCTDADPCTNDGTCAAGGCVFKSTLNCNDGNPCTSDSCAKGFGCFHAPQTAPCVADADACTDDVCIAGACVAVPSVSVCKIGGTCIAAGGMASGNTCLVCKPEISTKTWTKLHNVACQDGDLCTIFDSCTTGTCAGEKRICNDKNACTNDSCSAATGCVFTAISGKCNDGNSCTTGDACLNGACKGAIVTAQDCDDNNPCTTDRCLPVTGCDHKPHNLSCDDGNACTKADFCTAGNCVAGKAVCPCEFNGDCDDGNLCTIDTCVTGIGCANVPKSKDSVCTDGDACTSGDTCTNGVCLGVELGCDDDNTCTDDACASSVGCIYRPLQGKACVDGNTCTSADLCVDGTCMGTPKACDDGKSCTLDSCDKTTGVCAHNAAKELTPCPGDGISCTLDRCVKGICDHGVVVEDFCLIQGACLSGGAMHPAQQCRGCQPKLNQMGWAIFPGKSCNDGNACTDSMTCQKDGSCAGLTRSCDDSNVCTLDACDPQAKSGDPCVHTALHGTCDDGSDCTNKDGCVGTVCTGVAITCDDGDDCTDDGCQATGGCVYQDAVNGRGCPDDGLKCTLDTCQKGLCAHKPGKGWCAISAACIANGAANPNAACYACDASKQPLDWTPLQGTNCDDGDPCTGADVCSAGSCGGDGAKACDDNNPCTTDSCSAAKGCAHMAASGGCEDGDPCTINDSCASGKCLAGQPLTCIPNQQDEAACLMHVCLPDQGGCKKVSTCGALHACISGLCLTKLAGKPPGPVVVPLPPALAPQPLRPTLAWQESHSGALGETPQLWLVAQTAGCSPSLGVYAKIVTIQLPPSATAPTMQVLSTPAPTGGNAWCAAHPVLAPHPTTYNALALTWLEGGNEKSPCPWSSYGGRSRVALIGVGGDATVMTAGASCPAAGGASPLPWRPAVVLHSAQGSIGKSNPGQLSGMTIRPAASGGLVAWTGDVVSQWGGGKGALFPPAKLLGWKQLPRKSRAALSSWTNGQVAWATTAFVNASGQIIPALTATRISPLTGLSPTQQVVLAGAPISGVASYDAVEAVYDASSKRVAVLVAGKAKNGSKSSSFLAFSRINPGQGAAAAPMAVAVVELTAGQGSIQAFRLARLPNSDRFLVVWAAPGSTVLKAIRINPKDDTTFTVTSLGAIASDFVSHPVAAGVDSSGGLSELVIDPSGTRYSIAYEGVGTLHLLTAALPTTK